jgi:hypothetical protein
MNINSDIMKVKTGSSALMTHVPSTSFSSVQTLANASVIAAGRTRPTPRIQSNTLSQVARFGFSMAKSPVAVPRGLQKACAS